MACTEKMRNYAHVISKELGLKEPDYESFEDVSKFISNNKDTYNKMCFNKPIPQRMDYKQDRISKKLEPICQELYKQHGCYILWSGKEIVYVGKSINLGERIMTSTLERNKQKKITAITPIITTAEADAHILELVLISELKPILNSDTFCKDYSSVFKSNLKPQELKKHRYFLKENRNDKFRCLVFGG